MYNNNYKKRLYNERSPENVSADKERKKKTYAKRNRKETTSDNSNMSSICVKWDFSNCCEE